MLLSIGIDVGAKNGAVAIIDEDFNILCLCKAPYKEVDMAHTSKNRVKPKLNKETGLHIRNALGLIILSLGNYLNLI